MVKDSNGHLYGLRDSVPDRETYLKLHNAFLQLTIMTIRTEIFPSVVYNYHSHEHPMKNVHEGFTYLKHVSKQG